MQNFVFYSVRSVSLDGDSTLQRSHTQLQRGEMDHCLIKKLYSLAWASHSSGMTVVMYQLFQREDTGPCLSLLWGVICTVFRTIAKVHISGGFWVLFIISRILTIMPLTIDTSFYSNCSYFFLLRFLGNQRKH